MSKFDFLEDASNVRANRGSDRVLRCDKTGETAPLGEIADALAAKFDVDRRTVIVKLGNAVRNGTSAFGLQWTLESGTPYPATRDRAIKNVTPIKRKSKKSAA